MSSFVVSSSPQIDRSLYKPSTISSEKFLKSVKDSGLMDAMTALALNESKRREGEKLIAQSGVLKIQAEKAYEESKELESESKAHKASALKSKVEAQQLATLGHQQIASGQQNMAAALQGIASGQQMIASGQQKIELGQQIRQEAQAKKRKIIAEMFYATVHKKTDLTIDQIEELHSSYISEGITFQSLQGAKSYVQIESTKSFTKYLDDHKDTKMCNFKHFKQYVSDVRTLADYLAQSNCSVTSVWFSRHITDESKATLAEAAAKRNGTLKIQYSEQ